MVLGPSHKGRWAYACSKAIDEFLALAYWKERKLPTVVVRLFNTVARGRRGATAWSCRSSWAKRWEGGH
jgi:UDP-glucose 4-epimerase